ncbi:unnamed protein product [Discula destructiva]
MTTRPYGGLLVALTQKYELRWNDEKTGSKMDGSFWHPLLPDYLPDQKGLRPLGTLALSGYGDPNKVRATLLVGDYGGQGSVAAPTGYDQIYQDGKSGGSRDGAIWRPKAPDGYTALGDVCTNGYSAPSLDDIWCVRNELLSPGQYDGSCIWNDHGSKGTDSIAVWAVSPRDLSSLVLNSDKVPLNASTFIGVDKYDTSPDTRYAKVILVDAPAQIDPDGLSEAPKLESRVAPAPLTPLVRDRWVILPFTSVLGADDKESVDNMSESPFVSVERWGNWELAIFDNNTMTVAQDSSEMVTMGITKEQTESFSHSTGITIGAETGIVTKLKVELNYQFTYTSSNSLSTMQSSTQQHNLTTPSHCAAALWVQRFVFRVVRVATGAQVGKDLPFKINVSAHFQYPEASNGV